MADEPGPIVRVEGVSKTFGEVLALDSVSLEFERGIVYGLLGPNGAGKTMLIRVLTTLVRPDSSRVEVAGVDVVADPTTARTRTRGATTSTISAMRPARLDPEMAGS